MLQTPVLLLVFNRPLTTQKVFEAIRKARPKKLYIAADGPRKNNVNDAKLCFEVKQITAAIDWDCELKTLYRTENLGCKNAIWNAIDWFFEQEEEGIILEDDCVPDISFFDFCQTMLLRYKNDDNIKLISGSSLWFGKYDSSNDYFLSNYVNIWGWATWRTTWNLVNANYCEDKTNWKHIESSINKNIENPLVKTYLKQICLDTFYNKIINTWDIYLAASIIMNNGKTIVPFRNLIKNIGFVGTHANGTVSKSQNLPLVPINPVLGMLSVNTNFNKQYLSQIAMVIADSNSWYKKLKTYNSLSSQLKKTIQYIFK